MFQNLSNLATHVKWWAILIFKKNSAPIQPILITSEPFQKVVIDCVGPLPKTKRGNEYILTLMDPATRYPEAIPIKNISAKTIVRHLLNFITTRDFLM